jgi:hypothetical protein
LKIMFGVLLVFVALVAMIFGFGWMDGEFGNSLDGDVRISADGEMTGVEKTYLEFMIAHLDMSSTQISALGMLFSSPDFENEDWKAATFLAMSRIQASFANVVSLEPTERLAPFHESSLDTLSHGARFAEMAEEIVNAGSTELTDEAVTELVAAGNGFVKTEAVLNEFLKAHPVPEELLSRQPKQTGCGVTPSCGGTCTSGG